MITANNQTQTDPFEQASTLLGTASGKAQGLFEGAGSLGNINSYINPFYEQVLDRTLGRMNQNFGQQLSSIDSAAAGAGAFGGSRHGIVEGQARQGYNQNVGDISAQIGQQAYTDAANRATQDYMAGLTSTTGLADNLFGKGMQITDLNSRQGMQQQALMQQILNMAQGQYGEYMSNPMDMVNMYNALLSGDVRRGAGSGTTVQEYTPGTFDYLSLMAQVAAGGG